MRLLTLLRLPIAERAQTLRPHPVEGMYWHDNSQPNGLGGVPRPTHLRVISRRSSRALMTVDSVAPTSDDNMYRQYRVTITPHAKKGDKTKTFNVKVKVKNFHDNESPVRNTYMYLALVPRCTCRTVGIS